MKRALVVVATLAVTLTGSMFAAERPAKETRIAARIQIADVVAAPVQNDYPTVAADQTRPNRKASDFDCWSPCIQPYKCDIWTDSCVSQPVFGGCYIEAGQPPCVCWDSSCL